MAQWAAECCLPGGAACSPYCPARLSPRPAADVEIVGDRSGDEFEIEAIEESSSEDDEPLAARSRRPSSAGRRPLPAAAPAGGGGGAAAGAAAAAAAGGGGQRRIDSFVQRVPRGQASAQALAGPAAAEGRQQAGAMAMRPASAEEQQLDMLDYANRMVGAGAFARLRWLGGPIGLLVCCMCACCTYWLAGSRACRVSMQARLPFHQPDTSTRSMRSTLYPHPRRCLATPPSAPGSATLWRRR